MEGMAGDTGAPGFIPLYDDNTSFAPIQDPFNGIATAVNAALKASSFTTYPDLATLNLPANAGTAVNQHASVNADSTPANNGDYVWSGTAWIQTRSKTGNRSFATASGTGTNPNGAFGPVTFPTGRFTVAPLVFLQILGGAVAFPLISSVTATGFSGGAFNASGSAVAGSWNWTAVQMTATSAAG